MKKKLKKQKKLSESMYRELLEVVFKYGDKGIAQCSAIVTLVACVGMIADADTEKMELIVEILFNELEFVEMMDPAQVASAVVNETVH